MTKQRTMALAITLALAAWGSSATAASGTQIDDTAIDKGLAYLGSTPNAMTGFWAYGGYEPAATGAPELARLRLLGPAPASERGGRFVCVMVLAKDGRIVREFRGTVRGRIAAAPRGDSGFGYDPVFFYPRLRRTFAELPVEVKNGISHRGRAVRKLRRFLERTVRALPGSGPDRAPVLISVRSRRRP